MIAGGLVIVGLVVLTLLARELSRDYFYPYLVRKHQRERQEAREVEAFIAAMRGVSEVAARAGQSMQQMAVATARVGAAFREYVGRQS